MTDQIKVTISSYGPGRNLVMRYTDPITGKRIARSAETANRAEANKMAGVWQDELTSGRFVASSRMTWQEFRERCEDEKLAAMPESSQTAYGVALDHLERILAPDRVAKLTAQAMSTFQSRARKEGMKPTTIARNLRHIKACLRWGERMKYIPKAPTIEMPKLPKGQSLAKHRAVTAEEFDRIVDAVPKVRKHDAAAWIRLLNGLWLSGLRLGEAVILDWNDGPFVFNTTGKHPAFYIEAVGQKSREPEIAPTTPEFCEWVLAETPQTLRQGRVFPIVDPRTGKNLGDKQVGNIIRDIGKVAGVVVSSGERTVIKKGKRVTEHYKACAGAHDLRRAFCSRWSRKVMPAVLQRLARHGDISTTMKYYVQLEADDIGADLWSSYWSENGNGSSLGNTFGNTDPKSGSENNNEKGHKLLSDKDL